MTSKKTSKLRMSLVFSLVLHSALLAILALGAYTYTTSFAGDNGDSINAVMVDPTIMSEQNQRRMQQKTAMEQRERQRQAQTQAKAELLEKQRQAEQQRLKAVERKRLAAIAEKKRADNAAAQAKMRLAEQQQKAEQARKEAEVAKQKALADAEQAKQAAEALKKKAEEEAARVQAEKEKEQAVDDILGDLTSTSPAPQGTSKSEIAKFQSAVQSAISSKFRNPGIYNGKSCSLTINIAPDGMLIDVKPENTSSLCREAELAVKQAKLPKPSSDALYKKVKSLVIDFKPQFK